MQTSSTEALTFLFTDIEGSTRLWEEDPEGMQVALARHDRLMREAIERNGGSVFKTIGDAFCAMFPSARGALTAAVEAQLGLCGSAGGDPAGGETGGCGAAGRALPRLRVRMAINTGAAEARAGDFFGQALNRVARLLFAGHGGQVLLSQATVDLLGGELPPETTLRDLGEHRLKDLSQPVRILQVQHSALTGEFPPLRSLEAFAHNLPVQMTSFVGRERESNDLNGLLGAHRFVTLTGAAGCGKTRLALHVAAELVDQYPHGIWLVDLAALTDPNLVAQTVASVVGVREEAGRPLLDTLAEYLRSRTLLLILDNCEHLLDGSARLAARLLQSCPNVRILASSREGLGIPGEYAYTVPPLALPDPKHLPPLAELGRNEAIALFVDRAAVSQRGFELTGETAAAVAQICYRLDGIPLAIELAAARVRVLSVEQIASRLDDRFRLLTGGSRTALPRQQTLRAAIDWSFDLLTEPERAVMRRLSVFAGGWTLEAAEAVCPGEPVEDFEVLDFLSQLVEKSLVVAKTGLDEKVPYRMLLTVRQYARDRLLESGEAEPLRDRHRDWFVTLAETAAPNLQGAQQATWFNLLEAEHDNLRAALDWSLESAPELALQLASALWRFWSVRGYFTEGRDWLANSLLRAEPKPTEVRAAALRAAGVLALTQADYDFAQAYLEESLQFCRALGNERGVADALNTLGNVAWRRSDYATARGLYQESLGIERGLASDVGIVRALINLGNIACQQGEYAEARVMYQEALATKRAGGNRTWEAAVLHNLGEVAWFEGDCATAQPFFEQTLALRRELGDSLGAARALNNLGIIASHEGDPERARALCEEALSTSRELGDRQWEAIALANLGNVARRRGELQEARDALQQSLSIRRDLGDRNGIADTLDYLAILSSEQHAWDAAAQLHAAVQALREAIQVPLPPVDRTDHDRSVAAARAALGEPDFEAAWAEGYSMALEQAVEISLGGRGGLLDA